MSRNPFVPGQPASFERFVGRTVQIETAFDQIHHRGNLAVWGGPGMGKSSFLEYLRQPTVWQVHGINPDTAIITLVPCLSIVPFNRHNFWRFTLEQINHQIDEHQDLSPLVAQRLQQEVQQVSDLFAVLQKLGERNHFLLLLLDDYDVALHPNNHYEAEEAEQFLSEVRSLAVSEVRQYLSIIVTSSRRLNEMGPELTPEKSPWYNHYVFRQLKPLTDDEANELLSGLPMTPALREGIRAIADGNPALLSHAGSLLFDALRSGQIPDVKSFIQDFKDATVPIFDATWSLLTDLEQTLLMLVALEQLNGRLDSKKYDLGDLETIYSQHEVDLSSLVGRGILQSDMTLTETNYCFASSVMEWWVINQLQNTTNEDLQARQKIFLKLMSHKQFEKVKAAFGWIWQHRDKIPSLIKLVSNLFAPS